MKFSPKLGRNDGFSLVELLVVLAILSLGGAAIFYLSPSLRNPSAYDQARQVQSLASKALSVSTKTGKPSRLAVNIETRQILVASDGTVIDELVVSYDLALRTGRTLVTDQLQGDILFYPEGGSTGGEISLTDSKGKAVTLEINWLTGGNRLR